MNKDKQAHADKIRPQVAAAAQHLFTERKESVSDSLTGLEMVVRHADPNNELSADDRRHLAESVLGDEIKKGIEESEPAAPPSKGSKAA